MTTAQKVIKYLALAFALFIIVNIISGILFGVYCLANALGLDKSDNKNVENLKQISKNMDYTEITKLNIELAYSNLKIEQSDDFKIESNSPDVSVTQNNKQLIIKEKNNKWFFNKDANEVVVYIPENIIFDEVKIENGAGEIDIEKLETEKLNFEIGAGKVEIKKLNVSKQAKINGGAGKVEILSGEINNLDLDMGVGKFELTSKLTGKNDIDAGVGKLDVNLIGGKENYTIKSSKGLGTITLDGKQIANDGKYGDGECFIEINGGVGAIDVVITTVDSLND